MQARLMVELSTAPAEQMPAQVNNKARDCIYTSKLDQDTCYSTERRATITNSVAAIFSTQPVSAVYPKSVYVSFAYIHIYL